MTSTEARLLLDRSMTLAIAKRLILEAMGELTVLAISHDDRLARQTRAKLQTALSRLNELTDDREA